MTAAEALRTARAAGVEIALDGDDLVLEASSPPPEPVLEALSRNKAGIVALLRPGGDGWSAEDWQVYFDERAGIAEFDGGLPRPAAEAQAFACCVSEGMNRHPATSSPERCLACGGGDRPGDPLLPHGTATHGHAWLHSRCWPGAAMKPGKTKPPRLSWQWGWKNRPTFQTISGKPGEYDGWLWIGMVGGSGARYGGVLPRHRCERAAPGRVV